MQKYYRQDLAYVHDVGHADFALKSAPGILQTLHSNRIWDGLVVDLGCGTGIWAQQLKKAHYDVLGIDISESMIRIARKRVPDAEFRVGSLFKADIPQCRAVTSLGECLNYMFDPNGGRQKLVQLFSRIYKALTPGGVFIFDIAEPGQVPRDSVSRGFSQGEDWLVAVEKREGQKRQILTRRITSLRKAGRYYSRDEEVHHQRLYVSADIARQLRSVGFRVRRIRSYGQYDLAKAHAAFIARKPA